MYIEVIRDAEVIREIEYIIGLMEIKDRQTFGRLENILIWIKDNKKQMGDFYIEHDYRTNKYIITSYGYEITEDNIFDNKNIVLDCLYGLINI